mgnify:CR=1 FL=1
MQKSSADQAVLALYLARDEHAIEETAKQYGALCRSIALRILGNAQDAEECVNDTLLRAWESIPPEPEHLPAYLAALTRNLALNRLAERNALRRGGGQVPAALHELSELLPSADDVEHQADMHALTQAIAQFLRGEPVKNRRVFLRRYFSMMSVQEVAASLGMNENTVKSILKRTREKLRDFLEKEGIEI